MVEIVKISGKKLSILVEKNCQIVKIDGKKLSKLPKWVVKMVKNKKWLKNYSLSTVYQPLNTNLGERRA